MDYGGDERRKMYKAGIELINFCFYPLMLMLLNLGMYSLV